MNNIRVVRAPKNRIVREGMPIMAVRKLGRPNTRLLAGKTYDVIAVRGSQLCVLDEDGDVTWTDVDNWWGFTRTHIGYVVVKFDDAFRIAGLEAGGEYPVQAELKDHVDLKLISGRVLRVKKKRVTAIHSNPQAATEEYFSWKGNRERVAYQQREAEAKRKAAEKAREEAAAKTPERTYQPFLASSALADLARYCAQDVLWSSQLMPVAKPPALTINIPEGKTSVTITHGVHGETHLAFA